MKYLSRLDLIKLQISSPAQRTLSGHTAGPLFVSLWCALLLFALAPSAHAGEKEIRQSLQSNFPGIGKIEHIVITPYAGLYEILVEGQLLYTDAKGLYLFDGNVIETKTRRNISDERRRILFAIDFDKLPLELAVKKVKGNGKRRLAQFTDPNCSFCKRLEKELNKVTDITIYSFLYPIFPGSDELVRNVLCSKDPVKAWDNWMLNGITPEQALCDTPQTEQIKALGQKLRVNGTPNIIFGNGIQSPGYLSAEDLERNLNAPPGKI
ncbi:MAG: DsbC family protein [Pseudomonadota bacterium]